MPIRALDILSQRLPILDGSQRGHHHTIGTSGRSTTEAPTPKAITSFPPNTFQHCLGLPAVVRVLAQLDLVEAISTEEGHHLVNEGDIERASALYLLHPINVILGKGLLPLLKIPPVVFKCVGQYTMDSSRPDILYTVNGVPVLIVEYKHTNSLRESDWISKALVTPQRSARQIIASLGPLGTTALVGNAPHLVRQGSKYSNRCDIVVLFNYQDMVILDFAPGGVKWNDHDSIVNYQFFHGETNGLTFRQLLLAAFVFGMRRAGFRGLEARVEGRR